MYIGRSGGLGQYINAVWTMDFTTKQLANISTATKLDLVVCSKQFFTTEWDPEQDQSDDNLIETLTWSLARDQDVAVRTELSRQLSSCAKLPLELAEEIASDIEVVASPFLKVTKAFNDKQMADLVPFLKEHAHSVISSRPDIKAQTIFAIAKTGTARSVSVLAANSFILMGEDAARMIVHRFRDNEYLMNLLAVRLDLALDVVKEIINLVSSMAQQKLLENYAISNDLIGVKIKVRDVDWIYKQVAEADSHQIHSIAIGLRQRGELYHHQVLKVAQAGCFEFLESALALEAGETLSFVRDILTLRDGKAFVKLLQQAGVNKNLGAHFLRVVKDRNATVQETCNA